MIKMKICPFLFLKHSQRIECRGEDCAWFDRKSNKCAILLIPLIIDELNEVLHQRL